MKIFLFLIINFFSITSFVHASDKIGDLSECVGRLTVNFPYDVEVASASYDELKKQIAEPNFNPRYIFSDGEIPWSSKIFYLGPILISNDISEQKMLSLKKLFIEKRNNYIGFLKQNNLPKAKIGDISQISKNTIAWSVENGVRGFTSFDANLLIYYFSKNENLIQNTSSLNSFASNISYRKIFEIPPAPGLCFPHAFIRTNIFADRGVRATYKFIKHPDVTIWISEASATAELDDIREKNKQPKNVINSFWTQYGTLKGVKNVEPMLSIKNGASISLAGRKGIASFVKITRDSEVEDYGYYAAVRGEPGNEDAPDINVYVIRNSSFAAGEKPVTQDEFMRIVQDIQTSLVLRRN